MTIIWLSIYRSLKGSERQDLMSEKEKGVSLRIFNIFVC